MPSTISSVVVILLVICELFNYNDGFNIDLDSRIIHRSSQQGSMFGFTVALYKYGSSNTLLVGAPKFQTEQPGVWNGGAVLSCSSTNSNERCSYVPFDISGNSVHNLGFAIDNKTNQFFGATLKTSKEKGVVVACAPNYIWFTESVKKREPVGTCYVARKELTDFEEFSPCRTGKWGYHRQGSCQAGFDAAITSDGERMFIGAPGAYYWQGQIHSQSLIVQQESITTGEGPAIDDDQYMGYSVASGDFNGDGVQDMALGVPKGLNYTGKISLYTYDLNWIQNITGEQLGSYFGYCLSVLDFNNDGLDDILVGAPLYADFEDREMKIEVGKVYVFLQNQAHRFRHSVKYTGTFTKGRFGLSVTSLGDINYDSYGDFAVGEPYGGPDGKGAVYIYHGTDTHKDLSLDMKNPAQVIYASQVNAGLTFGWSLSGSVDMDNNQYPDLLIGAYESEQAFLLKSRPIIKFVHHTLTFESKGKTIDITTPNCKIRKRDFICMNLEFCITYDGVNVDRMIDLNVIYHLDTRQKTEQRMFFKANDLNYLEEKISFRKDRKKCQKRITYVKQGIVDKLTPITANVSYSLVESVRPARSLSPILNQDSTLSRQDSLTIQKNCGPDNVCIPDLVLSFDAPDEFQIGGSMEMVNVSVAVENKGEDAFEAAIFITEPKGLTLKKYEPQEQASCSTRKIGGKPFIKCDIGNPLAANQKVYFNVLFQQYGDLEEQYFEFVVTVNSTNAEEPENVANNVVHKRIEAKIDADISLYGTSDPEILVYNTTMYQVPIRLHEKHFGPSLIHKYGLVNNGPAVIENVEIFILWPTKTPSGRYLLYLLEQPITSGNIRCEPLSHLNPYNLELISNEEKAKAIGISSIDNTNWIDDGSEVSLNEIDGSFSSSSSGNSYSSSSGGSYSSSSGGSYSSSSSGSTYSSSSKDGSYLSQGGSGNQFYSSGGSSSSSPSRDRDSVGRGGYYTSTGTLGGSSSSQATGESSAGKIDGSYAYSSRGGQASSSGIRGQAGHSSSSSSGSILGSSVSGSSGSEADLANTLHVGRQGGLSSTLFAPSITSGQSGTYNEREENSLGERGSVSSSGGHYGGTGFSSSHESQGIRTDDSISSTVHGGGGGYSGRGYYSQNSQTSGSSISSPSYTSGGSYDARDYSNSQGLSSSGQYYTTSKDGKTTYYSSRDGGTRHYSSSSGDGDFNGDSKSGVNVHDDSYYTSTGDRGATYFSSSSQSRGSPYSSSSSYHHSSSSSHSAHDDLYNRNEIPTRRKRNAHDDFANIVKQCDDNVCTRIKCHTGRLEKNADVYIYIRSRLFVDTLKEDDMFVYPVDNLQITTKMVTKAHIKNYGVQKDFIKVDSKNVTTPIRSAKSLSHAPPIPWWVILLATLAGILILLLIILILWRFGFFERQKKGSS